MELEQLFNDREKNQLDKFVNNPELMGAVKKVVLSAVYFEGTIKKGGVRRPLENFCLAFADRRSMHLTREQIGEMLEVSLLAVQLLNDGFARLQRFNKKKPKQVEPDINPGR